MKAGGVEKRILERWVCSMVLGVRIAHLIVFIGLCRLGFVVYIVLGLYWVFILLLFLSCCLSVACIRFDIDAAPNITISTSLLIHPSHADYQRNHQFTC